MKEYKLCEGASATLKRITPKALKGLQEMGLFITQDNVTEALRKILEMFVNTDQLKKFVDLIFNISGEIKDYDELDIAEIQSGYNDFFGQLTKPSQP